ncbi:MAG: segregation/condensation protein A [Anaerolineae bacterium]|nr:segregation/condensation protein A [Anaerolineae bacterium]MDW8067638.1 segregation/condensation protein A [Anaerolineae bacterium]
MIRCYPIRLPVFEGPLDLLLQLIEREELEITAISLAQVTDQYLAIVEQMGRSLADLAAFLVVAAKLLLIKSRVLLPGYRSRSGEEDEVAADLIRQLETYRAYRALAGELARLEERGWRAYVRVPSSDSLRLPADPSAALAGVTLEDLLRAAQEALRAYPTPAAETLIALPQITVAEQMAWIQERLAQVGRLCFQDLLAELTGRTEIIITFLAVLELIKQERVRVWQEGLFGPIFIGRFERDSSG